MAFKRRKKAPSKKPPKKLWSKDEMKVIGWCLQNKIGVGISPDWKDEFMRWQIDLSINGRIHTDPSRYTDDNVLAKMYEYYKYYYEKH
jgi:hypothetical protein|tara:strand:+ start:183 stop:446 length:264 start_codon:yes stop_codon:yes gene_type:complete